MKKKMLETLKNSLSAPSESSGKSGESAQRKSIRIPTHRPSVSTKNSPKRPTQQVTKEWNEEAAHTYHFSEMLASPDRQTTDLKKKKINHFYSFSIFHLFEQMKRLTAVASHFVTKIGCEDDPSLPVKENPSDELWRDMMKPHEERHFQIGRITNYFS